MTRLFRWAAGALLVAMLLSLPLTIELFRISRTVDQFRLDAAVHRQAENDEAHKISVDDALNPRL